MPHVITFVGIVSMRVWVMINLLAQIKFSARQGREDLQKHIWMFTFIDKNTNQNRGNSSEWCRKEPAQQ